MWLFSHNRFNLFQFRDKDHLDIGKPSLRENLDAHLAEQGIHLPEGSRVRLITLPRIAGYIFNPVCFYFFSDAEGRPIHALVEVCNTFKELKPYLISAPDQPDRFRLTTPKHSTSHLSHHSIPSSISDSKSPDDKIEIHIDDLEGDNIVLLSWIRGKRRQLSNGRLLLCAIKYPLLTLQVIFKIHWAGNAPVAQENTVLPEGG